MSKKTKKAVTRMALIRAFTSPARTRRQTMEIVACYMGNSPVPPLWGLVGVRGTFGARIARAWARKIRHLEPARYRDDKTSCYLTPVVQTAYDLGRTAEELDKMTRSTLGHALEQVTPAPLVLVEFYLYGR